MRLLSLSFAVVATCIASVFAHPIAVRQAATSPPQVPITLVNDFLDGTANAYITGWDKAGKPVIVQANGQFFYPTGSSGTPSAITGNFKIALGGTGGSVTVTTPDYIVSGRIWFAQGELSFAATTDTIVLENSESDVRWGFVEFTNTAGGLFANISFVDFVGVLLGMSLKTADGNEQNTWGLVAGALPLICDDLKAQAALDGQPWDKLCLLDDAGKPLRVVSPRDYLVNGKTPFEAYWAAYVDKVWEKYATTPLTIATGAGVKCTVQGENLVCDGDNKPYAKPTASDIWGCSSGPFDSDFTGDNDIHKAIVPILCAAFNRGTLLLDGGEIQPKLLASSYYPINGVANHYARIVHKYEINGRGYAFSFDDVDASTEDDSGVVAANNPTGLTIYVGGPPSGVNTGGINTAPAPVPAPAASTTSSVAGAAPTDATPTSTIPTSSSIVPAATSTTISTTPPAPTTTSSSVPVATSVPTTDVPPPAPTTPAVSSPPAAASTDTVVPTTPVPTPAVPTTLVPTPAVSTTSVPTPPAPAPTTSSPAVGAAPVPTTPSGDKSPWSGPWSAQGSPNGGLVTEGQEPPQSNDKGAKTSAGKGSAKGTCKKKKRSTRKNRA